METEPKFSEPTQLFINGEFVDSVSKKTFPVHNPATGKIITQVSEGNEEDIDIAVKAADAAFNRWKNIPGELRAGYLHKLADLIESNAEEIGMIETMNNGMNITLATQVVSFSAYYLRYFAGYADKITGTTSKLINSNLFSFTLSEPIGVVGAIVPWNFPILLTMWKLAPCLACGNTVVFKPSEKTPLSILKIAELSVEAGFPPGVINVVPGYGHIAGEALARHMKVRKISFTGSVTTGKNILKAAAETNLKRVTLELGGKSPIIVCEDCDLDNAVEAAYNGIFLHQGQVCAAGSRVFVHESVYEKFIQKSATLAKERLSRTGDPATGDEHGPVVDSLQFTRVQKFIEQGIAEGAKVAAGGKIINRPGYYIEPTVFYDVHDDMTIAKEEIFGPVQSILKFTDLKDAIKRANRSEYGLAAGIFTNDVGKALAIASQIEAGSVWINNYGNIFPQTPFGGYKQSGIGRENGEYVLKEFLNVKNVTVQMSKL